ncbi:hypothetical protein NPIL_478231 [Nephila pilipes]|uniref:Uncharacterized protein n=1 Tax=Nephila pilipes TaxID=299642 RepID=A0A8X6QQ92_NEPPI|nr:hypothetical protein NPIL_478231 [Nephila pilipes]
MKIQRFRRLRFVMNSQRTQVETYCVLRPTKGQSVVRHFMVLRLVEHVPHIDDLVFKFNGLSTLRKWKDELALDLSFDVIVGRTAPIRILLDQFLGVY